MSSWGSRTVPATRTFLSESRVSRVSTEGIGPHSMSILFSSSTWLREFLISVRSARGLTCRQRSFPTGEHAFFSRMSMISKNSRAFNDFSSILKSVLDKPLFTLARESLSYHLVDGFPIRLTRYLGHQNLHHLAEVSHIHCLGFLNGFIDQGLDLFH